MIAVLTGDIINSQQSAIDLWLPKLKCVLKEYSEDNTQWDVFRGDSFQVKMKQNTAILAAFHIKALIKQYKNLDVRIAIGLGEETFKGKSIKESNGSAYVNSGVAFDALKKRNLAIKTRNSSFDEPINIMLNLALLNADYWSPVVAKTISVVFENPKKNQKEIAKLLQKAQSSISETLKRGGYDEIIAISNYYNSKLTDL